MARPLHSPARSVLLAVVSATALLCVTAAASPARAGDGGEGEAPARKSAAHVAAELVADGVPEPHVQRAVDVLEQVAALAAEVSAAQTCDSMEAALEAFALLQGPEFRSAFAAYGAVPATDQRQIETALGPYLASVGAKLQRGLDRCIEHEGVARAMEALDEDPPDPEPSGARRDVPGAEPETPASSLPESGSDAGSSPPL